MLVHDATIHYWRYLRCSFFHRRYYEVRQYKTTAACHCNKCGRTWVIGI